MAEETSGLHQAVKFSHSQRGNWQKKEKKKKAK